MIPAEVIRHTALTPEIHQLWLQPEAEFPFNAGDYLTLGFEAGDEKAAKDFHRFKPLSIANAPDTTQQKQPLELHIRLNKNQDADQAWMDKVAQLQPGDHVWIDGPFAQYHLAPDLKQPVILIAGGTGFSPMKALLEQLIKQGDTQPIDFYWGAKTADELYLHDWITDQAAQQANLTYHPVLSNEQKTGYAHGLVHKVVLQDFPNLSGKKVYICGPWVMQEAAKNDFLQAGLAASDFN